MKTKDFDLTRNLLAHIEYVQQCEQMLYMIARVARTGEEKESPEYKRGYAAIHGALFAKELDAWRTLFMFALAATPEQQMEIRARAYKRFLSERSSVAYLLTEDLEAPLRWLGDDEEKLRAWLKEHFAEDEAE